MKAILLGYNSEKNELLRTLQRLGCEAACDVAPDGDAGVVLVRSLRSLDEVKPYVQALHSVFVQRHALNTASLQSLDELADEAGVVVQFAAPAFYEWRLFELLPLLGEVKLAQVYSDVESRKSLLFADLQPELLCTLACLQSRIGRVEQQRSITPGTSAALGFRLDFESAASAYFWMSSNAIRHRHELRLYGNQSLAQVSMAGLRTLLKTPDDVVEEWTFLTKREAAEREIGDFIANVRGKRQPAVSVFAQVDFRLAMESLGE
jgi:hypothetical protein